MNKTLETFAREKIKNGLLQLTEDQQHLFKRMYSHECLTKDILLVVDDMPAEKLDWALSQVERSVEKALEELHVKNAECFRKAQIRGEHLRRQIKVDCGKTIFEEPLKPTFWEKFKKLF